MGTDQQPAPDVSATAGAPTRAEEDEWPETERPVWLGHRLHHWRFKEGFDAETNRYVASWPRWRASQARIADLATIIEVLVGVPQPSDPHGPDANSARIDVCWGGAVSFGSGNVRPWGLDLAYSAAEFRELDEQMVREARGFEIRAAFGDRRTSVLMLRSEPGIKLFVEGGDDVFRHQMKTAVDLGRWNPRSGTNTAFLTSAFLIAAVPQALAVGVSDNSALVMAWSIGAILLAVASSFAFKWFMPALEIVPAGHKNIARASRAVGRLIAAPAAIVTFIVTTARTLHVIS